MDFKLKLIFPLLILLSCSKPINDNRLSEEKFVEDFRYSVYISFLYQATKGEIADVLFKHNDVSYDRDGGFLPIKFNEQAQSYAKALFEKVDSTSFDGRRPVKYAIATLADQSNNRTLDSLAKQAYLTYCREYSSENQ